MENFDSRKTNLTISKTQKANLGTLAIDLGIVSKTCQWVRPRKQMDVLIGFSISPIGHARRLDLNPVALLGFVAIFSFSSQFSRFEKTGGFVITRQPMPLWCPLQSTVKC